MRHTKGCIGVEGIIINEGTGLHDEVVFRLFLVYTLREPTVYIPLPLNKIPWV